MSRRFDSFSVARSPYNGRGRELSRGVVAARRAAQVLTDKGRRNEGEKKKERPAFAEVRTAYKRKAERSLPVDEVDRVGLPPGGKKDWYERSKTRDTPQEQVGEFQDLLLPRICNLVRESRVTPKRVAAMSVGEGLLPRERQFLIEMFINRKGSFTFDWTECGKIHEDVSPPIEIKTIPHKAWQTPSFPVARALVPKIIQILKDRLERGVLEKYEGAYRNPWFLVAKKEVGEYRLINAAMKMNEVTLRDANLPPSVDEFSKEFADCMTASLVDFFSGYDQLGLALKSKDMTVFQTPLRLLRMTSVPQRATNSVM